MTTVRPFYLRALEWVSQLPHLTHNEMKVLHLISQSAHEDGEDYFITKEYIGRTTGMSHSTVKRAYKRLLELDLITETEINTDSRFAQLSPWIGAPVVPNETRLTNPHSA